MIETMSFTKTTNFAGNGSTFSVSSNANYIFETNVLGDTKEIPFIARETEKQDKIRLYAFCMHNIFQKIATHFILHRLKDVVF